MTTTHDHVHVYDFGPRPEDLARCVHCGFCLQACPTYVITSLETESPRGRIALARALSEGTIEATPNVVQHFDLCLQCRACETACPSGVPYGRIIEGARALVQSRSDRPKSWRLRATALRVMFASRWRLKLAFTGLRMYQRSPVAKWVRRVLPGRLRQMESMLPKLPDAFFEPPVIAAQPVGEVKATVALLTGCIMPMTHPQTHEATVRVLARNGIDAFLASGADYIVVNSAGCGSAMKEYSELFEHDKAYAGKAVRFVEGVRDVNELLVEIGYTPPTGRVDERVTYQDSCHLLHAQRIKDAPRELLRSIPGLELAEMATPDRCCGSAGIYNITQTEMSRQVLDLKMTDVMSTNCDVVCTANPGCMLQLDLGVRLSGGSQEVLHVVELLDRAYQAEESSGGASTTGREPSP